MYGKADKRPLQKCLVKAGKSNAKIYGPIPGIVLNHVLVLLSEAHRLAKSRFFSKKKTKIECDVRPSEDAFRRSKIGCVVLGKSLENRRRAHPRSQSAKQYPTEFRYKSLC